MERLTTLLILFVTALPVHTEELSQVVGEVASITSRYKNLTLRTLFSPLEVDFTVVQLANGKSYQLAEGIKGVASSTIVELNLVSEKTKSGFPLVVSGRTRSLVTNINGNKTILPLETPGEFSAIQ